MKKMSGFVGKFFGIIALFAACVVWGAPGAPPEALLRLDHPRVREVVALQQQLTPGFMALEGVLGTAVGQDHDGSLAVIVFVNIESHKAAGLQAAIAQQRLPGASLVAHLTEPFRAYAGKPGGSKIKVSHTAKQTPPIQLGTSGGWANDLANGYCCGGTLGSLVQIDGTQYIMSNYHVLEADIVEGGNGIVATDGSPVIQPGLIDVGCYANSAQTVATLVKRSSLPSSNVDVAIAQVVTGMVDSTGAILEIGTISASTVAPALRQAVKKSGRTTGLTRSSIIGLNATVTVSYANECAGGFAFSKTFYGQIVIRNKGNSFLNSGDSGSLMVEDVASNPRAVGLLFAGSSTTAIANPIGEVLGFLGATMVGQ